MNFRKKTRKTHSVDITPLIDVIFLLLLFFMITSSFVQKEKISVKLPSTGNGENLTKAITISITIDARNRIYLNQKYISPRKLKKALLETKSQFPQLEARVSADKNVQYDKIVFVLDQLKSAEITNLSLISEKK